MDLPESYRRFLDEYPDIADAYEDLGEAIHEGGPLPQDLRILVKLGIALGARMEGAVHSQVRKALEAGLEPDEIRHAALLAITTIGFPAAMAGLSWVEDILMEGPQRA